MSYKESISEIKRRCDQKEKDIRELSAWKNKRDSDLNEIARWKEYISKEVMIHRDWRNKSIVWITILGVIGLKIIDVLLTKIMNAL